MRKYIRNIALLAMTTLLFSLFTGCSNSNTTQPTSETTSNANWPQKPIQITVPYSAGGDTDIYARIAAKYLQNALGKPVVIINTTGASGLNAANEVLKADPDGYSILFNQTSQSMVEAMGLAQFSYYDDFELGGAIIQDDTYVIVVRKDSGFQNLQQLIDYAKINPNKLIISTVHGTMPHIAALQLEKAANIELKKIDVGSSSADRVAAFLGKQIDILTANYAQVKDYVATGDFIALGFYSEQRVPSIPDIPTLKEQGLADAVLAKNYSYNFPKGTDPVIVEKFAKTLEEISKNEEFNREIEALYGQVRYLSPKELYELQKANVTSFKEIFESDLPK